MFRSLFVAAALAFAPSLISCDRSKPSSGTPASSSAVAPGALPSGLFLAAAPPGATDVRDAKPALKDGDRVVLVGRIGGSREPFVAERAIFTLVDRRLPSCGEGDAMDACETPWDYCCEERGDITANSVTVQTLGSDGRPIKAELNGVKGLKPLATVTVVGTVAKAEGENIVVSASGFFIEP